MPKSTMVELVEELEKRNVDGKYDQIISEAKAGDYHDFRSEVHAVPKVMLVNRLGEFPELKDIALDVMTGVYDE